VYPNVATAGSGAILPLPAEPMELNVPNTTDHTHLSITETLRGAAKVIVKLTPLDPKPKRGNHAHTNSSASTAKEITK